MVKYHFPADVIRVVAIFGVLLIHLVYPIYARTDYLWGGAWWVATILNSFSRVSIPLFIMLSGYLVLSKKESVKKSIRRAKTRLLIPLGIWFGFYLWWDRYFFSIKHSAQEILSMMFGSNMFHLYFLVILAGLYLLAPTLRILLSKLSRKQIKPYIFASFIAGIWIYLAPYLLTRDMTQVNSFTIWMPYLGYFLVGWWFAKFKPKHDDKFGLLFLLSFVLTLMLSINNVYARSRGEDILWRASGLSLFDEFLSPNVILMSVGLFGYLIHNPWLKKVKNIFVRLGIKELAGASFAVYLIHFVVLNVLDYRYDFAIEFVEGSVLQYFLTRSSIAIALSFVAGIILVRLPIVRKSFGLR